MKSQDNEDHRTFFGADRRVIALGMARMADGLGNSFIIVVLPLYIASGNITGDPFGLSDALITGLILGLFGLVSSACQPFAGRLSDRLGKRQVFVLGGLVLLTSANFLYLVASGYWGLLGIRVLQGMGAAMTITASVALISEVSRRGNRGTNMGLYNSFRLIGFGAGPLASGALVEGGPYHMPLIGQLSGFDTAFYAAGLAALLSTILVMLFVRDPDETEPNNEKLVLRVLAEKTGRLLDPIFALGLATFIMSTGFALLASIEPNVNARLSQGAFLFSIEFSALIGAVAVTQPLVGNASDRFGRKRFIVMGLVCLVPVTLVQGWVNAPWEMITARALQGISAAMVFAPALAYAGDLAREGQAGAQLSVLTVAFGLGISAGSFLSGYAIRFGFPAPFVVGAVLAGIGAVLVQTQVPKDKRAKPEVVPA